MTEIIGAGGKMLIQEVVDKYGISRPTIMKALKAGQLSGQQDQTTKRWYIEPSEAQRWASTKKRRKSSAATAVHDAVPDQSELVDVMKDQVRQLQAQLEVKDQQLVVRDEQIDKAQPTIDTGDL